VRWRILGPVEVESDDGRVHTLARLQERSVLAILLLNPGRVTPVDRLVTLLWDDNPPAEPRQAVHSHISRIRRLLTDAGAADHGIALISRRGGYLLKMDPDLVDAHRFRRLLTAARHSTDLTERERLLREALALWQGPTLNTPPGDPVRQRLCADLDELHLQAQEELLATGIDLGRHHEILPDLAQLGVEHPDRQRLVELHMTALHLDGRTTDALDLYRRTRDRLADDQGLDPDPSLRRLHSAILRGEPVRLAGALLSPAVPAPPVPAQLPADVPAFAGRTDHLERLDALLPDPHGAPSTTAVVITAIAGTAGVGKTSLTLHWAHRVRLRFPDGQLYVNLRGYAAGPALRPIDALAGFLPALGVPAGQVPTDVDQAAALYRSLLANKRLLVVLDNARDVDQVRPLLPGAPGCLVLVTSRDRLGGLVARDGAHRIGLDVLRPEEAHAVLAGILGAARVAAEPDAAAALAAACAYLPLALRIAAADLVNHPGKRIADLVDELATGDRLAALHVDGDDQSAVQAAFDLSYASLTADQRRLFRLFGLFPGTDLTPATAAALAGTSAPRATRLLDQLAATHLLTEHTPGRYTTHDLLRDYAAERSHHEDPGPDRTAATDRLYHHYVRTAWAAASLVRPDLMRLRAHPPGPDATIPDPPTRFDDIDQALAWLDAERANLVAAVSHAATHGPFPAAAQLAEALHGYLALRLHMVDWYTVADAGRLAARKAGDQSTESAAEFSLGVADTVQDRHDQAIAHGNRALTLARATGWRIGQAAALNQLGTVSWRTGHLATATDQYHDALTIWQHLADTEGQVAATHNLAIVHYDTGDLRRSVELSTKALALRRHIDGSPRVHALIHGVLGHTHHALGRFTEATEHLNRGITLNREVSNRWHEAVHLCWLAEVYRDTGRYDEALHLIHTALDLVADTAPGRRQPEGLNILATIQHRLGNHTIAHTHHHKALHLAQHTQARRPEIEAHLGLATITPHSTPANIQAARTHAHEALTLAREGGYRIPQGHAHTALATLHLATGQPEPAIEHARKALTLHRDTGHRRGVADSHRLLGNAYQHTGDTHGAHEHRHHARALHTDIGAE
jgi:DNA-binding SARP family transcriptional activator/Flp pilus assembly protein TadD